MGFDFDLFVIGGGSAGVRCGRIAAAHGARVGVAEGRFWGGTCVNIGCVPKKILVQAAEYGAHAEDAVGFGWRGAAAGVHDWAALIAAKDREIARLNGTYRRLLEGVGATVFEAQARFLDPHRIAVGDTEISAERIVIATGGRPLRPDIPGAELGIVSDDAFYLDQRPGRVVILGSGYIAVEFAGIFRGLGAEVDLVFRQPLPLRGFDRDLREAMAEALVAQGVRLFPESNIAAVEAMGTGRVAVLADGRRIAADCVFFASGRGANTEGLGLDHAGVATSASGAVMIGEQWRTNVAHIHAIGDVTDRLNLTPVATAEGHALADLLFAGRARAWNFAAVPTAVFSTPPLATVGLSEEDAAARGKTDIYLTRFTPMRHTISGRARKTLIKLVVEQASGRVLGAHMFGEDAPEIIQGIAVAVTAGATKAEFDQTIGIHPTAAEEFVTLRQITRTVGGA
jgi:glutathione reductase (NADPH)